MRPCKTIRTWLTTGTMSLVLASSMSAATLAGVPGGGGGRTNLFVGTWVGVDDTPIPGTGFFLRYDFTFTNDYHFTVVETDPRTGVFSTYTGTYSFGGIGPDGLPLVTLVSGGKILLREEYSVYSGMLLLRGTIFTSLVRF